MLRLLLLALILANAAYFAWSNGLLRAYGFAPAQQNEPQRLAQQIRPEAIRVLSESEFKQAEAHAQTDSTPRECLQAGLFDDVQATALRLALAKILPDGTWQLDTVLQPARWIVYMGKYPNAEALAKKRTELSNLNLKIENLSNPALEMGLSLGGFDTQAAANTELARLNLRGIRTAHVVQEREEGHASVLKLPVVTEALKGRLDDLKSALAGKTLRKCGS